MSFFKEDILKINGFDMRFEAPCLGEDCDIEFRLNLIGIKNKSLKLLAPQIHLYHPELSRQSPHSEMYREILKKKESWTEFGIDTLKK
jgi:hypothetical protein